MLEKKIAFIGSGVMAEAMIFGLLGQKLARSENLCTSDPLRERVQELHEKYGVQPFTDNNKAIEHADVVVLSLKPQRLTEVLGSLKGAVPFGAD
jgi:pyrroline-5-carboxylate reductase